MDKKLPAFIYADERRSDNVKFILVEIDGYFFIAAEAEPTVHNNIEQDLRKILLDKNIRGYFYIHGGGQIWFLNDENTIKAFSTSGDFGAFDAPTVEETLRSAFTDKLITVEGYPRVALPKSFIVS